MRRIEDRGNPRREQRMDYSGLDRRRFNYDRRKMQDRRKVKPPMSAAGEAARHDAGYVARLVSEIAETVKASREEARMIYGEPKAVKTAELLRGLSLDKNIR